MKRFFFYLLTIFIFFSFNFNLVVKGQYATCDLCGFCPPANPPANWASCAACLYPGLYSGKPIPDKKTLQIDSSTNLPPTPYPGRQYTMIGCIQTNAGFSSQEGVVGVVQFLLKNIIFSIVGGLAFIFLVYGSFVLITSQNNPEKLDYGKRIIYGAIIGLIFSISSVFIVRFIAASILKIPGFGGL